MLFKLKNVASLLCSFCKATDETYIHLFHSCLRTSILGQREKKNVSDLAGWKKKLPEIIFFAKNYNFAIS